MAGRDQIGLMMQDRLGYDLWHYDDLKVDLQMDPLRSAFTYDPVKASLIDLAKEPTFQGMRVKNGMRQADAEKAEADLAASGLGGASRSERSTAEQFESDKQNAAAMAAMSL